MMAGDSVGGSGFNRIAPNADHPGALRYEFRQDSFPMVAVNNMNIRIADISKKKAPITKHSSYNHNMRSRENSKMIEEQKQRLNKSTRSNCKSDLNQKEIEKKKIMALERQNREILPSFETSSRLLNPTCSISTTLSKTIGKKTPSNVTILGCSYVSQNQVLPKPKPSPFPTQKLSDRAGETIKKLEIQNFNNFTLGDPDEKLHPKMALGFQSFNNSKTNLKKIDSVKDEEFSGLGKRKEINLHDQKGLFQAHSFESRELTSRMSSLKRRKMSDTSKQKELPGQSEFDSINPLNQHPSMCSQFKSFQANNSMSDFVMEQSLPKKKKTRHSTGVHQPKPKHEQLHSKNTNFSTNLKDLKIIPNRIKSDHKGNSSQNISSLNDISGSIKYRVNSNTVSSNSNYISSLNEIEKMKQGLLEKPKEESRQSNSRKVLHKIIESEDVNNAQKKK